MTFELPEPALPHSRLVTSKGVFGDLYTADQMQAAYAAGRAAALEDAAKKVEEVHEFYGVAPAETIRGMK